jgi:hypothetical protein
MKNSTTTDKNVSKINEMVPADRILTIREMSNAGLSNAVPAGAMAPVIYFPGALFYSAGFNVNQNFEEKIFLNNSMFQYFFVALP